MQPTNDAFQNELADAAANTAFLALTLDAVLYRQTATPLQEHAPVGYLPNQHTQTAKPTLIIVDPLTETQLAFLHKIMAAVSLQPADFEIHSLLASDQWLLEKRSFALHFGAVSSLNAAFQGFDAYLPIQPVNGGPALLLAHTLPEIEASTELKKKLWTALKQLFTKG